MKQVSKNSTQNIDPHTDQSVPLETSKAEVHHLPLRCLELRKAPTGVCSHFSVQLLKTGSVTSDILYRKN
jgi:hypothetical protein